MIDQILKDISIQFDAGDHRELTPFIFFTEGYTYYQVSDYFKNPTLKDRRRNPLTDRILDDIRTDIYSKKYFGEDQDEKLNYEKNAIKSLEYALQTSNSSTIEENFTSLTRLIYYQQSDAHSLFHELKRKIIRDLQQMAISTVRFPHYVSVDLNNFHALQDLGIDETDSEKIEREKLKSDEDKMKEIISKTQDNEQIVSYDLNDLTEFYEILSKHKRSFTFSPSFIISCIQKLDSFVNSLIGKTNKPSQNQEEKIENNDKKHFEYFRNIDSADLSDDEKQTKLNYFHIVLKIKMRLYMMIHKTNEFLCLLIEMLILNNDQNVLNQIINETLPDTKSRSKIIKNISSSEIIDFCFSHNEKNDFILTNDGVFKCCSIKDKIKDDFLIFDTSSLEKVEFKCTENSLKSFTKSKIASSKGVLYLISSEDQKIYQALIDDTDEKVPQKVTPTKYLQKEKEPKKEIKMTKKKLREQERKERKRQSRMAHKESKAEELNTDYISIHISDSPIISVGAYNNYIRIIQKKSINNGKTTLVLTSIDLSPDCRTYNVEEAFSTEKTTSQTQFEFEIQDKNDNIKIQDICFAKDKIFILFEDSTIEQWTIYNNGVAEFSMNVISPYIISPQTIAKMDNNNFLYVLEPVSAESEKVVSVKKFHLPYTKYYIRSENKIFLKYPYLQKLSDVVDNCSHLIINREITKNFTIKELQEAHNDNDDDDNKKKKEKKVKEINPFEFSVSPSEMSFVVQSISSLSYHIDYIKSLIENLKDEDLKKFFIPLFIKICGINVLYGTGFYLKMKDRMSDITFEKFQNIKKFICDLYGSFGSSNSHDLEIMIRESMFILISLCGKFVFLPDSYNELHSIMHELLKTPNLLRSLSYLLFSYPSSLYIIDDVVYNELFKLDQEVNLHELFINTIIFIKLELRFAKKIINIDFIQNITPYIESLFKYINYLITDESNPIIKAEQMLSYMIAIDTSNQRYSLILEKEMIGISEILYNRIKKIKGVLESDQEFYKGNQDFTDSKIKKVTKVFESEHPYNLNPPNEDKIISKNDDTVIEEIGTVDFGTDADQIYLKVDRRTKLQDDDQFSLYLNLQEERYNPIYLNDIDDFSFYEIKKYNATKIKVNLVRKLDDTPKGNCWGYKLTFIGDTFDNPFYYLPNIHLNFYNNFIYYLTNVFSNAIISYDFEENAKDFDLILKENIIQGIKLEDIDNYEQNLNLESKVQKNKEKPHKPIKRTLTRGISRGINYDTDNDANYDDQFKKSFIKDLLTVNDDSKTLGKQLFDILYTKTAKQNRIKLNKNNISILENEHYLAACLFKQLGLINVCIKFIKNVQINDNNKDKYEGIEIPVRLQTLWKNIYSLRKALFFEYQKSKSISNASANTKQNKKYSFTEYSEEIKRKCKLLLYSDPILKFKERGNLSTKTIEEATKSIMSFVTSKTPISAISELIDKRTEKLSMSSQSSLLMKSFIENKLFFESSKLTFAKYFRIGYISIEKFQGVKHHELNDFKALYGSLSYSVIKEIFTNPTVSIYLCSGVLLKQAIFQIEDQESMLEISKIFIDILEKNKQNKSFIHDRVNILSILVILGIAGKTKNDELIDYILLLLSSNDIDLKSKELLLIVIPLLCQLIPGNKKIANKSLPFSILCNNMNSPIIIRSTFYWIASIFNSQKRRLSFDVNQANNPYLQMSSEEFIIKVLRGIGQSICGKSCLFIDDSFQSFSHRQVSEGMIMFIRLLVNEKNSSILRVIDDILIQTLNNIKTKLSDIPEDELMALIGLFTSLSQNLSASEPERYFSNDLNDNSINYIIGLNTTNNGIQTHDCSYGGRNIYYGYYTNFVLFDPKKLDLNEKEIGNILQLHNIIIHSKYFTEVQRYENEINEEEVKENILISSFYNFLPIIVQNKNNAKLILNEENISRSLSLFELATKTIPSNENSLLLLSHYLEKAVLDPLYQSREKEEIKIIDNKGMFRFLKANYGEIVYNDDGEKNDIIKADPNRRNVFFCTRPFNSSCKSYFEVKINKIGMKRFFIGVVDSEAYSIDAASGFGSVGSKDIFCRKSPLLQDRINLINDKIMKSEQKHHDENENKSNNTIELIKEGDTIGCYYTPEYSYLIINRKVSPYRLSNKSTLSYVPLICIDHDEIELEITQNLTLIKEIQQEFEFLNIDNLPPDYFKAKDFQKVVQKQYRGRFRTDGQIKEKCYFIGQQVLLSKIFADECQSNLENIDAFPKDLLRYRDNYGIIKDMKPLNDDSYVSKMIIESYNNFTLCKENIEVEIDSRFIKKIKTKFFNVLENLSKTKFGYNSSYNLNDLPQKYQISGDFNEMRNFLRNKTIKENSKSISILTCRYLSFILVDYLRYSKSILLQDEGINSKEMNVIIKSLAISTPNITIFKPKFYNRIDMENDSKYLIFQDDINEKEDLNEKLQDRNKPYLPIGFGKFIRKSFLLFLKKSEKFISKYFVFKLLEESYEYSKNKNISINDLYYMIPSLFRIESITPLPSEFTFNCRMEDDYYYNNNLILGYIPILISSIPDQLPSINIDDKLKLRLSTNDISYIQSEDIYYIDVVWKADIKKLKNMKINKNKSFDPSEYDNYKLKFCLFSISKYLNENMLMNSYGFIQTIFLIFQSFSNSNDLYEKHKEMFQGEFINNLFSLASNKNMIAQPYIQMIIANIISKSGFPKSLFDGNINNSLSIFTDNSNKLVQLMKYPNYKNELPLLFSIYSNLCQTHLLELEVNKNEEKTEILFDKYYQMNKQLFKITNDSISKAEKEYFEGEIADDDGYSDEDEKKKKKNFRTLYLAYYYSLLLSNEMNIPYPKFIFVNDLLMQHFGGFRKAISKEDIDEYITNNKDQTNDEQTIEYKSEIQENKFELTCSCNLINIKDDDENDSNEDYEDDSYEDYEDDDEFNEEESKDEDNEEENKNEDNEEENKNEGNEEENKDEDKDKSKEKEDNKKDEKKVDKDKNKNKKNKKGEYKIFIHQINDDSRIEVPKSGEEITVSFPLEIYVIHEKGRTSKKLKSGDAFIIDFIPSESQQREYFIQHYKEIEKYFDEFVLLSKYDNELSEKSSISVETTNATKEEPAQPQNSNNENSHNENNNNNNENSHNENNNNNNDDSSDDSFHFDSDDEDDNEVKFTRDDYKIYEINKIPDTLPSSFLTFSDNIVSLRCSTQSTYRRLIEEIMGSYGLNEDDDDESSEGFNNWYTDQIIKPAYSMKSDVKFKFIFKIMANNSTDEDKPTILFNRFEQQKYMEKFNDDDENKKKATTNDESAKYRPLFIQFMEQLAEDSIPLLRNRHDNPFTADLVGENATDAGGPGRELFSQLIEELMNVHVGVFTANPNNRHKIKDVNKEDLIPNPHGDEIEELESNEEISGMLQHRFIYAGALIACSIVSVIPQPMKLSMQVWEYLTKEKVSIESVYEVDNNFKEMIQSAEQLYSQISTDFDSISEQVFEQVFPHNFQIDDSFDNPIELIPSGSKTKVTKKNVHEFIELAKKVRCEEFKDQLKDLKNGFDKVMNSKNIMKILRPPELKLLVCGEPNCSVKSMKTMINVSPSYQISDGEKLTQMFWNVMESFSVEERMKFIRFSSGNLSLPAPGMKWEEDIEVDILSPNEEGQSGKDLAYATTCSSRIEIPYFQSEKQLATMLRKSCEFSGLITDSHENADEVSEFM